MKEHFQTVPGTFQRHIIFELRMYNIQNALSHQLLLFFYQAVTIGNISFNINVVFLIGLDASITMLITKFALQSTHIIIILLLTNKIK